MYDVVVVGSGAGAGPVIYELARAGFSVLVLEKGPRFRTVDFRKDELAATRRNVYTPDPHKEFHEVAYTEDGEMVSFTTRGGEWGFWNGNMVGGSTNVMSGYFQRMRPVDFRLLSEFGEIPGAAPADWPFGYEELEPYYAKVEQVVGISGKARPDLTGTPRSTPDFPYPPLEENIVARFLDDAARKSGYGLAPTPRAILSRPRGSRQACYYSHYCGSYGCASDAKGSARVALIDPAMQTGMVTLISGATVYGLQTDGRYRVKEAHFITADGRKHIARGRLFVVAAQAVETVRLLLLSRTPEFPEGLLNNRGLVGRYMLFSAGGTGRGEFHHEDFDPETFKAIRKPGVFINRTLTSFYELEDPRTGERIKGGIVDFIFEHANPVPRARRLQYRNGKLITGAALPRRIRDHFLGVRTVKFEIFTDWIPHEGTRVTLSKRHKDFRGFPVARIRVDAHPAQSRPARILARHASRLLREAGARNVTASVSDWPPPNLQAGGVRAGLDPATSVLNKWCQAHEVPNLFVTDGSFMPTGGSVPYTWTIYANSFRVADYIKGQFSPRG
ncbi:MAG: GMC family oxidoreductase [Chlorobi bacterium]|nr:GMC family oxidoreductase [Chlorobiota bacterium]